MKAGSISIVVPVYKSGPWLEELAARIGGVFANRKETFELVLVNDASPDDVTWPKIEELAARFPWVRGFDMLYNVGQFGAIVCGLEQALGEFIITMDDDLQHPPEELPKLINAIHEHPDMVCVMGLYETKRHSWFRNLGSHLFGFILNRTYGKQSTVRTSSFRIMRRELAEAITRYRTARPLLGSMTIQLTRKIMNVPVAHHPRPHGRSGYSLLRLVRCTLDAIIYKSTLPLRFFSFFGFCTAAVAFLLGFIVFVEWMFGRILVAGYASIVLTIAFFSGTILMGIGVVGEYIARVISEVSGPPRYQVRRAAGLQK